MALKFLNYKGHSRRENCARHTWTIQWQWDTHTHTRVTINLAEIFITKHPWNVIGRSIQCKCEQTKSVIIIHFGHGLSQAQTTKKVDGGLMQAKCNAKTNSWMAFRALNYSRAENMSNETKRQWNHRKSWIEYPSKWTIHLANGLDSIWHGCDRTMSVKSTV